MISTKSLYTQIIDIVEKKSTRYASGAVKSDKSSRSDSDVASLVNTATTDDVLKSISDVLANVIESRIITGLAVVETNTPSLSVVVKSGTGTAGGKYYTVSQDTIININVLPDVSVYYINIYQTGIKVESKASSIGLTIAKVVAPYTYNTVAIYNRKDDIRGDERSKAYIQSFTKYNLYGYNDRFEEDTVELLRDNIGEILADSLIGNLRLSENLKITNTYGSIELNSNSIVVKNTSGATLSKLNESGVYLYRIDGAELARFTSKDARIGNILITPNYLASSDFLSGYRGFKIASSGNAEFNDVTVRGTIYADTGIIGGFTIAENELYATTMGTIRTSATAGSGSNGVVLDKDGLRVYNDLLGLVVNLPSDGSAPIFSSGIIRSTIYELYISSVIRTSATVGDGTANSAGVLMNDTGLYGCGANQTLSQANFKILSTGDAYFNGEIKALSGQIGNTTITSTGLYGGLISGTLLRGTAIETSEVFPKIRIDVDGVYYQITSGVGTYGEEGSGSTGFLYGDGTLYGTGVTAYLFNINFPVLAITSEVTDTADIRLYNREVTPTEGTHELGDLIVVDSRLKICETPGTPGIFETIVQSSEATGGTDSAGSGKQYVAVRIGGVVYRLLHDGTI